MKLHIVLPFLLAPVAGVLIGVQIFEGTEHAAGTRGSEKTGSVQTQPAGQQASGLPQASTADGSGPATTGFAFADLMSIMRKGGPGVSAPALRASFEATLQQPPGENKTRAMQSAFTGWVLEAPAEALARMDSIPAEERQTIVANALAALAQQRPETFASYSRAIGQETGTVIAATLGAMSESNPSEALAWIAQYPNLDAKGELTAVVLPGLIRSNVALAAQTVASMTDRAPVALIQQVAVSYAQQDPAQAYQWVNQVIQERSDASPAQLLNHVSSSLAASNPAEAAKYLNRTDDPAIRKSLMSEIAIRQGQESLTTAWNWLSQYNSDPLYAEAAQDLLYRWSYTKPEEVARILPTLTNQELQAAAGTRLSLFWQQRDQASYQAWLASLPPGSLKEAATLAQ